MSRPDEAGDTAGRRIKFTYWLSGFLLLSITVPGVIIVLLPSDQRPDAVATLASVPLIEYMAVGVGIGLGMDLVPSFIITVSTCIGITMLVTGLFVLLSERSPRMRKFQERVQKKVEKYPRFVKYGVVSSFVLVMITGVYIFPGISYILGWDPPRAITFMALGIATITLVIGLGTVGIINLFFV